MKTRKGIGLVLVIALLVLANACLDYTAVCKALDVDSLFDGAVTEIVSGSEEGQAMLVSNIIAIVISLGCAATLWVLPRVGANNFAMGSRKACAAALGSAASIALVIAGLRFASDVASTMFESGEATAVLKGVFLVLVMLALSRLPGLSVYGVSIGGAAGHNIGQMAAALITLGNTAVLGYLPFLLVVSLFTGALTGFVSALLLRAISHVKLSH